MPPRGRPSRGRGGNKAAATTAFTPGGRNVAKTAGGVLSDDSDEEYKPGAKRRSSASVPSPKTARTTVMTTTPKPGPASRTQSVSTPPPGPASRVSKIASVKPTVVAPISSKPADVAFKPVQMRYDSKFSDESLVKNSSMMHDCIVCGKKDGRNLKLGPEGISDLKYHYAVCYYEDDGVNRYRPYIDPGILNKREDGSVVEEYGARFKYLCPFKDCAKNKAREKRMGYKEFCIHSGVAHHLVERVMEEDVDGGREELEQVLEAVARDRKGAEVVELPQVAVEEVHTCYICKGKDRSTGKDDKEAKYLSLTDNISRTRYHYAQCLYDTGVYQSKYPPGPENTDENGGVKDLLGREIKYSCRVPGCTQKRMMGYKEFCIHMGNEHGGLDEVLAEDDRTEVREMGRRIVSKK